MEAIKLVLFKIRKSLYLVFEAIQAALLPLPLRTGKYFDDPLYTENDLLPQDRIDLKRVAYLNLLKRIEKKGLFVLGNSRSGTTILKRILNGSREVYLLGEANLFRESSRTDFREYYNQKHATRRAQTKAKYIPRPIFPEMNGMVTLDRLGSKNKYVGEKNAFGYFHDRDAWLDYQTRFFLDSTYFFIVRKPAETVFSMSKMFRKKSPMTISFHG